MEVLDTEKLEKLLKEVSDEIINFRKEGYEVVIQLPNDFFTGCKLAVYKSITISEDNFDHMKSAIV